MRRFPLLGARGESDADMRDRDAYERTERVVRRLGGQGWTVLAPFADRAGRWAHVVIGPPGVFLIVARKPPGSVRVRDGVPWVCDAAGAEHAGTQINRTVLDPAHALDREIRARAGADAVVHPVVALWSEFPQRVAQTSRIAFVDGRELASWLHARPAELAGDGVERVAGAARDVLAQRVRRPARLRRPHAV